MFRKHPLNFGTVIQKVKFIEVLYHPLNFGTVIQKVKFIEILYDSIKQSGSHDLRKHLR